MTRLGPCATLAPILGLLLTITAGCSHPTSYTATVTAYPGSTSPGSVSARESGSNASLGSPRLRNWTPEVAGSSESVTESAFILPGMSCLVNKHGFRVKVLAKDRGVRCVEQVPGGELTGSPLKHFQPYFVFDVWPTEGPAQYFKVGSTPRLDSVIGWASAKKVARWDSRVGVRYHRQEGKRTPPLLIYKDKESLIEILETGVASADPMARARLEAGQTLMPWPVAESELVTVDGNVFELVRLNFLAEILEGAEIEGGEFDFDDYAADEDAYTADEMEEILSEIERLDIVFCLDNTHSTGPYLEAMRNAVRQITNQVGRLSFKPDVNLGLVMYRDYVDGLMFQAGSRQSVTRNFGLKSNINAFLAEIEDLSIPNTTSDGFAEAGYDGLMAALTGTPWRGDRLSARVIVLIGDNSFHLPGEEKNPFGIGLEDVRDEAARRGVQIFTLNIYGGGGSPEQERHTDQFQGIADACGGESFTLIGADGEHFDAGPMVDSIQKISGGQMEVVGMRAEVTHYLAKGKKASEIVAETEMDERQIVEVMEFLAGAGIDVEKLGPGKPTFATGWALVEVQDVEILEREIYLARNELDILLSALNQLRSVLSGSTEIGRMVGQLSFLAHSDPLSDFFSGNATEDLDVFLMAKGIPVGRSSILRLSSTEVDHMSEETRRSLHENIAKWSIPTLTNALNDDSLWSLRDVHEFGWVAEDALP